MSTVPARPQRSSAPARGPFEPDWLYKIQSWLWLHYIKFCTDDSCTADRQKHRKKALQDVKDSLRKSMWNGEIIGVWLLVSRKVKHCCAVCIHSNLYVCLCRSYSEYSSKGLQLRWTFKGKWREMERTQDFLCFVFFVVVALLYYSFTKTASHQISFFIKWEKKMYCRLLLNMHFLYSMCCICME